MKAVKLVHDNEGVERHLSLADMDQLGVKYPSSQAGLVWRGSKSIVMSNEMSDSLVAALPGEFTAVDADEVDETEPAKKVETVDTSGTSGPPDGAPSRAVKS